MHRHATDLGSWLWRFVQLLQYFVGKPLFALAGSTPSSEKGVVAGIYLVLGGRRPTPWQSEAF